MLDDVEYGGEYGPAAGWRNAAPVYMVRLLLAVRCSVTFTYLEVV